MFDAEKRRDADGETATNAPPIVVIAEDWATSRRRAANTRAIIFAAALLGIGAYLAPRVMPTSEVNAASVASPPSAQAVVASALSDVQLAPRGAISVSPIPDSRATLERHGIRVRKMTPDEARAARLENAGNAWLVANLAPHVDTLAIDDVILGQCGASAPAAQTAAVAPLPICFMRSGEIYATTLRAG